MKHVIGMLLLMLVAAGCATKEEQARTHISQIWRISKVFQNGQEVTDTYTSTRISYALSIDNDGTFRETYYPFSGADLVTVNGTWYFSDGINKVTLAGTSQSRIFQIDLLDDSHFNVTDLGSTNNRMIEYLPQ